MLGIDGKVSKVIRTISYGSAFCLIGIMVVAFVNMLIEKLFHTGIPMSTEIIQYLHVPVVFLAVSWVTIDQGHVTIDFLTSKFSQRLQAVLENAGYVLSALICGFVAWRGFVQMGNFIATHKRSSTGLASFPLWPWTLVFSIGASLLAFSFVWMIIRRANGLGGGGGTAGIEEIAEEEEMA